MKTDQEQRGNPPYQTSTRGIPPPLVSTDFTVHDDGECMSVSRGASVCDQGKRVCQVLWGAGGNCNFV